MSLNKSILLLVVLLSSCFAVFGQNKEELDRLDSLAFSALEHDESDVTEKAQTLLEASIKQKSPLHEINAYTLLGIVNKNKGYYITSINNYLKALNAAERINDNARVSACYSNIGSVYQLQENYPKALSYFQKSLKLEEELNNPLQESIRLYNIGEAYSDLDSMNIALTYFNRSLIIETNYKSLEGINYALLGIADVYVKLDRPVEASIALGQISSSLDSANVEQLIMYHLIKGELLLSQSNFNESLIQLDSANVISLENEFRVYLTDIYSRQIEIFNELGNWKESVERYKKYVSLKNELNSIKVKNQLEDLTFQNELNKKELEIKLVQEERDLAKRNEQSEKNRSAYETRIIWFLIFSIVLILGVIIYGIKRITKS